MLICVIFTTLVLFTDSFYAYSHNIDDMILDDYQYFLFTGIKDKGNPDGSLNNGVTDEDYKWSNGELPYELSNELNSREKKAVKEAVAHFNSKLGGCIQIRPKRSGDQSYVRVIKGSGCYSWLGRKQSNQHQTLSLGFGCYARDTIMHEFIHAFGFNHEQNRPDRDDYVKIHFENILPGFENQFQIKKFAPETFDVPYNGKSIMHYESTDLSKNGEPTITSKIQSIPTHQLGSGTDLAESDILKLKKMYCPTGPKPNPNPNPPIDDCDCPPPYTRIIDKEYPFLCLCQPPLPKPSTPKYDNCDCNCGYWDDACWDSCFEC